MKRKTKLKKVHDSSNTHPESHSLTKTGKFSFEKDIYSKSAQGKAVIMQEAFIITKFLQTTPQTKNENIYYYGLYYTLILIFSNRGGI